MKASTPLFVKRIASWRTHMRSKSWPDHPERHNPVHERIVVESDRDQRRGGGMPNPDRDSPNHRLID